MFFRPLRYPRVVLFQATAHVVAQSDVEFPGGIPQDVDPVLLVRHFNSPFGNERDYDGGAVGVNVTFSPAASLDSSRQIFGDYLVMRHSAPECATVRPRFAGIQESCQKSQKAAEGQRLTSKHQDFRANSDPFAITHWSLVLRAGGHGSGNAAAALVSLCQSYWRPLYGYVRRRVPDLLTALKHFLAKEGGKRRAQKRGGGRTVLSLDFEQENSGTERGVSAERSPEEEYDRRWAMELLERVLQRLGEEYSRFGNAGVDMRRLRGVICKQPARAS